MCDRCEILEAEIYDLKRLYRLDEDALMVGKLKSALHLSKAEARLLYRYYLSPGKTLASSAVWGIMYGDRIDGGPEPKIIGVYICKIRKKIGFDSIKTVSGIGYELTPEGRAKLDEALA